MKRIISALLLVLFALNLVSCGAASETVKDDTAAVSGTAAETTAAAQGVGQAEPSGFTDTTDSSAAGGICTVHGTAMTYHGYPSELIAYVGEESFNSWIEQKEKESEGYNDRGFMWKSNIYGFIHDFDIPREKFVEICNDSMLYYRDDYNIELLYGDDPAAVDAYYRDYQSRQSEMTKRGNFSSLKGELTLRNLDAVHKNFGENSVTGDYSFAELVYMLNIPRDELEALIAESVSRFAPGSYLTELYGYDLDTLYNKKDNVEKLIKEQTPFYVDCIFYGVEPAQAPYK